MICNRCADVADANRLEFDVDMGGGPSYWLHPTNCGCACQHHAPQEWQAQFSTEQPE